MSKWIVDAHADTVEAIEVNGVKYVPERTCHMEFRKHGAIYDVFYFDCCDEEFSESRTDQYASGISGNVCPYCGAKVVGE